MSGTVPVAEIDLLHDLWNRMGRLEKALGVLIDQRTVKDWYTTSEVGEILKKAEFTVREWCRLRRIHAEKRKSGRGPHTAWVISHQELQRFQREGLLPINVLLPVGRSY